MAVCAVLVLIAPPVRAQTGGACPSTGVSGASVDVDSPVAGQRVSGIVSVRGTVSATVTVSRVELLVGRSLVDAQTFPARSRTSFTLTWDATRASPGRTTLRVVACGRGVGAELVHGSTSVAVEVADPSPRPQPGAVPAPPAEASTTSAPTSTAPPSSTSTSTATSTTSTSTSTTAPAPTTTEEQSNLVAAGGVRLGGRLVTAPVEDGERRSRPLWVGGVVGLSGLAGLAFSRVLRGRRRRRQPVGIT